jgi:hypothetical protein
MDSPTNLHLRHPQADALRVALASVGLPSIPVTNGPALLRATLQTPKGLIEIHT